MFVNTTLNIYAAEILPSKYSINLMWISKTLNDKQCYIYPLNNPELREDKKDLKDYKANLDKYKDLQKIDTLNTYYKLTLYQYKRQLQNTDSNCYLYDKKNDFEEHKTAFLNGCSELEEKLNKFFEQSYLNEDQLNEYKSKLNGYKKHLDKYKTYLDKIDQKKEFDPYPKKQKTFIQKYQAYTAREEEFIEKNFINLDANKLEVEKNNNLNKQALDTYKDKLEKANLYRKFLRYVFGWAKINEGSKVNIWYDSEFTIKKAVENTQKLIRLYAEKNSKSASIMLRDVREIPLVNANPEIFNDKINVYFRVDILRPIIALHIIPKETDYFVYSDIDVDPLSKEDLFADKETLMQLKNYGMLLGRTENGFQIIYNNKKFLNALEYTVVELNIQRAYNALKGKLSGITGYASESPTEALTEAVYNSYAGMAAYIDDLNKTEPLYVHSDYKKNIYNYTGVNDYNRYNKEKDGLGPFAPQFNMIPYHWLSNEQASWNMPLNFSSKIPSFWLVIIPPSRFNAGGLFK